MEKLVDLTAVAFSILLVMMIAWPFLKKGARSQEERTERWKILWQGGFICWILGIVFVQAIGHLRREVESIDRDAEVRMQQIREKYQQHD